jgi:hypothetical protein
VRITHVDADLNAHRRSGKKGNDSAAAKYAAATPSDGFSIQEDKPYAEVRRR